MSSRSVPGSELQESQIDATQSRRGWPFVPRRPSSVWGWLMWLLVVLLFFLLIYYVLVPWWYSPVPTNVPPPTPNTTSVRSGR